MPMDAPCAVRPDAAVSGNRRGRASKPAQCTGATARAPAPRLRRFETRRLRLTFPRSPDACESAGYTGGREGNGAPGMSDDVAALIEAANGGDASALQALFTYVYGE